VVKVDRKALLEKHVSNPKAIPWKLIKLKSPKIDADSIARERRQLQNQLSAHMGAMNEVSAGDIQSRATLNDDEIRQGESLIRPLEAQAEMCSIYRRELQTYENQLARHEVEAKNYSEAARSLEKINLELQSLAVPSPVDLDAQKKIDAYLAHARETEGKKQPAPAIPTFKEMPEGSCPKCGQIVPEKLKEHMAHEKDQALMAYNQKAREVADLNTQLSQIAEDDRKKAEEIQSEGVRKSNALYAYNSKKQSLEGQRQSIQKLVAPVAPHKPEAPECFVQESQITQQLSDLKAKISGAKLFISQRETNRRRHEELSKEVAVINQQLLPLEEVESVLKRLPEIEIQETKDKLAIPGVEVKLVEGALDVRVNRIPYPSLSSGRKIKTDFLWATKIQELLTNRAPGFYFCDDSDLVDRFEGYLPQGAQVFFACVHPDLKELRVVQL
jgi:hypothetical protein